MLSVLCLRSLLADFFFMTKNEMPSPKPLIFYRAGKCWPLWGSDKPQGGAFRLLEPLPPVGTRWLGAAVPSPAAWGHSPRRGEVMVFTLILSLQTSW